MRPGKKGRETERVARQESPVPCMRNRLRDDTKTTTEPYFLGNTEVVIGAILIGETLIEDSRAQA